MDYASHRPGPEADREIEKSPEKYHFSSKEGSYRL